MSFLDRVSQLPVLGIGVSTEYGAAESPGALNPLELHRQQPTMAAFLEIGVEVHKGLDPAAASWVEAGLATTYHFLDINLDEPEDLEAAWLAQVQALTDRMKPAWMCGDAGLWHLGRRERGHMLLLPPILTDESATALAEGIVRLREATGYEVLPENPPGAAYIGNLHLLDFFARVADRADTGLLLDCAHLAIYQRMMGHSPLDGLDGFPLDRVVEVHVAGGTERESHGFAWVEDDHTTDVLPDTWTILEAIAPRAINLRAVVYECERNGVQDVTAGFEAIAQRVAPTPAGSAT